MSDRSADQAAGETVGQPRRRGRRRLVHLGVEMLPNEMVVVAWFSGDGKFPTHCMSMGGKEEETYRIHIDRLPRGR
jgi:hypothetical protein